MSSRSADRISQITGFDRLSHADKLRTMAWALHAEGSEHLRTADFAKCFEELHLAPPANLHRSVQSIVLQGDLLRSREGYRLAKQRRDECEKKYGARGLTVQVHELLDRLPSRLTSPPQAEYLDEAVRCFRAGAWRASMIMTWNLAFDHLCEVILRHLPTFNAGFVKAFPHSRYKFATRSDLREAKESAIIKACRTSDLVDKTAAKCLDRSLEIRNDAAHPSGAPFNQPKAEAFILDLVETVVIALKV